jgi:hypothetical protein
MKRGAGVEKINVGDSSWFVILGGEPDESGSADYEIGQAPPAIGADKLTA